MGPQGESSPQSFGRAGIAILGIKSVAPQVRQLLLYDAKKQPIVTVPITSTFICSPQADNYVVFYDGASEAWAMMLQSAEEWEKLAMALAVARGLAAQTELRPQPWDEVWQDVVVGDGGAAAERVPVSEGDTVQVHYSVHVAVPNESGQLAPAVESTPGKGLKLEVGSGRSGSSRLPSGLERGLIGMLKGGRRFILVAPLQTPDASPLAPLPPIPAQATLLCYDVTITRHRKRKGTQQLPQLPPPHGSSSSSPVTTPPQTAEDAAQLPPPSLLLLSDPPPSSASSGPLGSPRASTRASASSSRSGSPLPPEARASSGGADVAPAGADVAPAGPSLLDRMARLGRKLEELPQPPPAVLQPPPPESPRVSLAGPGPPPGNQPESATWHQESGGLAPANSVPAAAAAELSEQPSLERNEGSRQGSPGEVGSPPLEVRAPPLNATTMPGCCCCGPHVCCVRRSGTSQATSQENGGCQMAGPDWQSKHEIVSALQQLSATVEEMKRLMTPPRQVAPGDWCQGGRSAATGSFFFGWEEDWARGPMRGAPQGGVPQAGRGQAGHRLGEMGEGGREVGGRGGVEEEEEVNDVRVEGLVESVAFMLAENRELRRRLAEAQRRESSVTRAGPTARVRQALDGTQRAAAALSECARELVEAISESRTDTTGRNGTGMEGMDAAKKEHLPEDDAISAKQGLPSVVVRGKDHTSPLHGSEADPDTPVTLPASSTERHEDEDPPSEMSGTELSTTCDEPAN